MELPRPAAADAGMSRRPTFTDRLLRWPVALAARLVRGLRVPDEAQPAGVHALALTPDGLLILVRLRYAPGWRLPGGGRDSGEDHREATLRELREEIGMTGHGRVRPVPGLGSVMIVEDVLYRPPRWSWEVEAIVAADLAALPGDLSPRAARWIEIAARHI